MLIRSRGPADVSAMARRAKPIGETFQPCRQIRIAAWNSMTASGDVRPQFCQLLYRQSGRVPVGVERGSRPGQVPLAGNESGPGIHVHGGEGVAGEEDAVRWPKEGDVTGRMPGRGKPFPTGQARDFVWLQLADPSRQVVSTRWHEAGKECDGA